MRLAEIKKNKEERRPIKWTILTTATTIAVSSWNGHFLSIDGMPGGFAIHIMQK
jgi:hypothetical protein